MATACTLSRRSVHPACASAPSAPALPTFEGSCSPLADCHYAKPAASANYPPMTFAEVAAPAAGLPVPCPPTPAPASPFAPAPSSASSASYGMPSPAPSAACYPPAMPAAAYGMPPPAPQAQYAYPPPADDKVQPRGCFNCSPETGAAIGTILGGALAVVGVFALELLRFAIIFA